MCSEPVTLGGGMTMLKRGLPDAGFGAERANRLPERVPARIDLGMLEPLGSSAS